jgi:hypothetical protein
MIFWFALLMLVVYLFETSYRAERPIIFKYNSNIERWMAKYEDDDVWTYHTTKAGAINRCREKRLQW